MPQFLVSKKDFHLSFHKFGIGFSIYISQFPKPKKPTRCLSGN